MMTMTISPDNYEFPTQDTYVYRGGREVHAPDLTRMMHAAIRAHINSPTPDVVMNIETHLFNVLLHAKSCVYALDVGKELWLNRQRWSRLIKEYLALETWERFQYQAVEILRGDARLGATANMLFRDPDRYAKKHRWGGCLMGATFRGDGKKSGLATLTFFSRTTYIGYMGLMDVAIAAVMAREIAALAVKGGNSAVRSAGDIEFRWHISSSQLHCFKTLPFIYSQPDLMKQLSKLDRNRSLITKKSPRVSPTWHHTARWYFKVVDGYDAALALTEDNALACQTMLAGEKYGPFKRIKRRWLEHKGYLDKHVPPSLKVEELDFAKAV